MSTTASANDYHQSVAGASQTYLYSGESSNYEAKLSRLVFRDAANKTTLSLRGYRALSYDVFFGGPLDKPEYFRTSHRTAGFNLTVSF